MRKVILGLAVTLDGYIEGPNGEYDWCFTDQDYGLTEFFSRIDAALIGRKSYEVAQEYAAATHGQLAPGMPAATTYVVSVTLDKVKGGAVVLRQNLGAARQRHLAVWRCIAHRCPNEGRAGRRTVAIRPPHPTGQRQAALPPRGGPHAADASGKQNVRNRAGVAPVPA